MKGKAVGEAWWARWWARGVGVAFLCAVASPTQTPLLLFTWTHTDQRNEDVHSGFRPIEYLSSEASRGYLEA